MLTYLPRTQIHWHLCEGLFWPLMWTALFPSWDPGLTFIFCFLMADETWKPCASAFPAQWAVPLNCEPESTLPFLRAALVWYFIIAMRKEASTVARLSPKFSAIFSLLLVRATALGDTPIRTHLCFTIRSFLQPAWSEFGSISSLTQSSYSLRTQLVPIISDGPAQRKTVSFITPVLSVFSASHHWIKKNLNFIKSCKSIK